MLGIMGWHTGDSIQYFTTYNSTVYCIKWNRILYRQWTGSNTE